MEKPFSASCERNQGAILDVLKKIIKPSDRHLLEIGSGTGQHAVFMSPNFPKMEWHTADLLENHAGINRWLDGVNSKCITRPIHYEAGLTGFPSLMVDIVFTANTLHIMSWENAKTLMRQLGNNLKKNAQVVIYGPFNYGGEFTSGSNAKFDEWLKRQEPHRGIRDFELVVTRMTKAGFNLLDDCVMPSNNRILHFIKQ